MQHKDIRPFKKTVWDYYKKNGRHSLPWRKTKNAYRILVSEIMLQQTQVSRVLPKYRAFLKKFPTVNHLAHAPLREVLVLWQGLGYNRRAKYLHQCAQTVVQYHNGKVPTEYDKLAELPGIGPYTAGAVTIFSNNTTHPLIETNIRTVYLHHFFSTQKDVTDAEIIHLVEKTIDTNNPREWYWALMDYGAYLKASGVRTNSRSKHYTKQSTFKGSDRQLRGAILRALAKGEPMGTHLLSKKTQTNIKKVEIQVTALFREGLIQKHKRRWCL